MNALLFFGAVCIALPAGYAIGRAHEFTRAYIDKSARIHRRQAIENAILSALRDDSKSADDLHRHIAGELGPDISDADIYERLVALRRPNVVTTNSAHQYEITP
jgi:hypothetical protein